MRQLKVPNPYFVLTLIGILVLVASIGILLNATLDLDGDDAVLFPTLTTTPALKQDIKQNIYPPQGSLVSGSQDGLIHPGFLPPSGLDIDKND